MPHGSRAGGEPDDAVQTGEMLWRPGTQRLERANLTAHPLAGRTRRPFESYADVWQWSVDDPEGFWGSVWDYFQVVASSPYERRWVEVFDQACGTRRHSVAAADVAGGGL